MGNKEGKSGMGGGQNCRGGPKEMEKIAEERVGEDGENSRGKGGDKQNGRISTIDQFYEFVE